MSKFIQIALIVAFVAICCAEPARVKNRQSRLSARQEAVEDVPAQTPYPPAGIVPQVRFDLPTENVAADPERTYLPPDNTAPTGIPAKTYGPPEAVKPKAANDDDAITEEPEEAETETEQPEDLDAQPDVQDPLNDEAEDNEIETESENDPQDEELLLVVPLSPRPKTARIQARPLIPVRAQRVIAQPIPYRSQRLIGQQLYFADGRFFAYTPQYASA